MALQFNPPPQEPRKSQAQALLEPIGQAVQTLPALWAQYKAQRMDQDLKLKLLQKQLDDSNFERESKTKELGLKEQDLSLQKEKETRTAANQAELLGIRKQMADTAGRKVESQLGKEAQKKEGLQQAAVAQADRIISKVDQALQKVGGTSAGIGSKLSWLPGSKAKNLSTDLLSIKANLGFAELQAMRQASPTGGALGQVAVQELEALQSTLASLDQGQSPEQLRERLGEVKAHYEKWKQAVQQATQEGTEQPEAVGDDFEDLRAMGLIEG